MDPLEQYIQRNSPDSGDPLEAYVAKNQPPSTEDSEPSTGAGEAALEHYGNTATMGYLPHIQAAAEDLTPDPGADTDAKLRAQGFRIEQPDHSYLSSRDANLKRLELEGQEHPVASGIGTAAGIAASALLPAGAVAKEASLGAKALQGAKLGAAYGAIANPGDKEGEIDPLQLVARAKNAAVGGALGAAVPVATQGAQTAAEKVGDFLRKKAAEKAFRSFGRGTPNAMQKMVNSGQNVEIGRTALDEGAIPFLGTPSRIASRVDKLKNAAGDDISDLVKGAGAAKVVDAQKLGIDILDSPEMELMRKTPGMENAVASIEKQVETLAKNGQMDIGEAQALRQQIDKSINWNKGTPDVGVAKGLKMQRSAIRDAMNEGINSLNPGEAQDQLLAANKRYSNLATARGILDKELARNQSNRAVSLTDTIAGGAGLAAGGPLGAAVLGGLNKAGRTFGNSMQARVYDAISKKLPMVAGAASSAQANPVVAQAIAQRLGQGAPALRPEDSPILNNPKIMQMFKSDPSLIDAIQDDETRGKVKRALGISQRPGSRGISSTPPAGENGP